MRPFGPSGFGVEPEPLRGLATAFGLEAARLGATIPQFEGAATQVQQAFGLLGPSNEVYFEYLALVRNTVGGLQDLRQALERTAEGLRTTAEAYEEAEVNSSVPMLPAGG